MNRQIDCADFLLVLSTHPACEWTLIGSDTTGHVKLASYNTIKLRIIAGAARTFLLWISEFSSNYPKFKSEHIGYQGQAFLYYNTQHKSSHLSSFNLLEHNFSSFHSYISNKFTFALLWFNPLLYLLAAALDLDLWPQCTP